MREIYLSNCKMVIVTAENMLGVMETEPSIVMRFTTHYFASEDRIQMCLECDKSEDQILWLTRRLLNRLISILLTKTVSLPSGVSADNNPKVDAIQKFAQSAAVGKLQLNKKRASIKRPKNNAEAHLVTEINIQKKKNSLELVFKTENNGKTFSIKFTDTTLRQWLSILYSRYHGAEWTEEFWPTWLRTDGLNQHVKKHLN